MQQPSLFFFALLALASARPYPRVRFDNPSEGRTYPLHYESSSKRGFNNDDDSALTYSIDISKNVRILDYEMSVDEIECSGDLIKVTTSNTPEILNWGSNGFYLVGGREWGCGDIVRKVTGVYEENNKVVMRTTEAEYTDVLENADISLSEKAFSFNDRKIPSKHHFNSAEVMILEGFRADVSTVESNGFAFVSPVEDEEFIAGGEIKVSIKCGDNCSHYTHYFHKLYLSGSESTLVLTTDPIQIESLDYTITTDSTLTTGSYYITTVLCNSSVCDSDEHKSPVFKVLKPEFAILSPTSIYAYNMNFSQNVNLTWNNDPAYDNERIVLRLFIDDGSVVKSLNETNSAKWKVFNMSGYPAGQYYFSIGYGCDDSYKCKAKIDGERFNLLDSDSDVYIHFMYPDFGDHFYSGDLINVTWEQSGLKGGDELTLSLNRDQYIKDKIVFKDVIHVDEYKRIGIYPYEVPSGMKDDTRYYFKIEYKSGKTKVYTESKRFSINHQQKFVFTSPLKDQEYTPGEEIKVLWNVADKKMENKDITVSIVKNAPTDISSLTVTKASVKANKGEFSYTPKDSFFFSLYAVIKYDCNWFGINCQTECSKPFYVPFNKGVSLNNDNGTVKNSDYKVFSAPFNQSNKDKWAYSADITCKDCFANADIEVYGLSIQIVKAKVREVSFFIDTNATVDIGKLFVDAFGTVNLGYKNKVAKFSFDFPTTIGPVPIVLFLDIAFSPFVDINANATVNASMTFAKKMNLKVEGVYTSSSKSPKFSFAFLPYTNDRSISIDACLSGAVMVKAGLEVSPSIGIKKIVTIETTLSPHIDDTIAVSTVPFKPNEYSDQYHLCENTFHLNVPYKLKVFGYELLSGNKSFFPSKVGFLNQTTAQKQVLEIILPASFEKYALDNKYSRSFIENGVRNEIAEFTGIHPCNVLMVANKSCIAVSLASVLMEQSKRDEFAMSLQNLKSPLWAKESFSVILGSKCSEYLTPKDCETPCVWYDDKCKNPKFKEVGDYSFGSKPSFIITLALVAFAFMVSSSH